jgi:hypothetical protein
MLVQFIPTLLKALKDILSFKAGGGASESLLFIALLAFVFGSTYMGFTPPEQLQRVLDLVIGFIGGNAYQRRANGGRAARPSTKPPFPLANK